MSDWTMKDIPDVQGREENPQTAARLWEVSEELIGVKYEAFRLDP
jgi:hypothetical protein